MPSHSISAPTTSVGDPSNSSIQVAIVSDGPEQPIFIGGKWSMDAQSGKYFVVWDNDGVLTEVGAFIVPGGIAGTFAAALKLPAGEYRLGSSGTPGGIAVYSGVFAKDSSAGGWSIGLPDALLTNSLIHMAAPLGAVRL